MKEDWFLFAVVLLYAAAALIDQDIAADSIVYFIHLLVQIVPVIALVFLLMFTVNSLLEPKQVVRHLGHGSGLRGWFLAVVAGILCTGPIYVWYPLLSDLRKQGMRTGLVAAFLYVRGVKLPLLPLMVFYFGIVFTLLITAFIILFAVITGFLTEYSLKIPHDDHRIP
jgi:uncharacterized membrane protein YraQ (UPF0718 family)